MTSKYVMDTYAWVEYFIASPSGNKVKAILEAGEAEVYTNVVTLSETISAIFRRGLIAEETLEVILSHSNIFYVDIDFAKEVGVLHAETKKKIKSIGLTDVYVLLTARKVGGRVLTGDPHFKGFKEVVMI